MLTEFLSQTAVNVVLALVPPVLGHRLGRTPPGRIGLGTVVSGLVWLVFLPNSAYLLTEWRHFLFDEPFTTWREGGQQDRTGMFLTAVAGFVYIGYAGFGLVTFTLALRPVDALFRRRGWRRLPVAPVLFFLVSLGVYIGLFNRLNSWDLVRPAWVLEHCVGALSHVRSIIAISGFALVLWLAYEAADLWFDALAARWNRFRASRRSTSTTSAARPSATRDQPADRA